jgi:protein-disulfide isomerase
VNQRRTALVLGLLSLSAATTQCANTVGDPNPKLGAVDVPAPAGSSRPSPAKVDGQDEVPATVRVSIDGLPTYGSSRALVTLVAFTDYECPYCVRAQETVEALREEYGDQLRVVVASNPLPFHENASGAARAFLAAIEQGKGEAMHARLFANKTKNLGPDGLRAAAADLGLDLAAFDRARSDTSTEDGLGRVEKLAGVLSVTGTPTFFVNGRRILGAQPIETFRATIDEELGKANALLAKGVPAEAIYATLMAAAPEYVPSKESIALSDEVVDVGTEEAPIRGAANAPVTVVVFSDFECPFCARASR